MKKLQAVLSKEAPTMKDALWIKPVDGGVSIKVLVGNKWCSLKVEDDPVEEAFEKEGAAAAMKTEIIGSVKDKKSANTINGAKAYADNKANTIIGSKSDEASDLTLYGLKAYIDKALKSE